MKGKLTSTIEFLLRRHMVNNTLQKSGPLSHPLHCGCSSEPKSICTVLTWTFLCFVCESSPNASGGSLSIKSPGCVPNPYPQEEEAEAHMKNASNITKPEKWPENRHKLSLAHDSILLHLLKDYTALQSIFSAMIAIVPRSEE